MGRPTDEQRRARRTEEALRKFADAIPEILLDVVAAIRDTSTPASVRAQLICSVDRLTSLLPNGGVPPPPLEKDDEETKATREALTRLCHDDYGSDEAFEKRLARNAERRAEAERDEMDLELKIERVESLKATYLAAVEDRPIGTPSVASGNDAAAPAPDPPPAMLPAGAPPERTMLPAERGRRDGGRHEW